MKAEEEDTSFQDQCEKCSGLHVFTEKKNGKLSFYSSSWKSEGERERAAE